MSDFLARLVDKLPALTVATSPATVATSPAATAIAFSVCRHRRYQAYLLAMPGCVPPGRVAIFIARSATPDYWNPAPI